MNATWLKASCLVIGLFCLSLPSYAESSGDAAIRQQRELMKAELSNEFPRQGAAIQTLLEDWTKYRQHPHSGLEIYYIRGPVVSRRNELAYSFARQLFRDKEPLVITEGALASAANINEYVGGAQSRLPMWLSDDHGGRNGGVVIRRGYMEPTAFRILKNALRREKNLVLIVSYSYPEEILNGSDADKPIPAVMEVDCDQTLMKAWRPKKK